MAFHDLDEIRGAMHALADRPLPTGVADRALKNATRVRRRRAAVAAGAFAAAVALAIPLIGRVTADRPAYAAAAPLFGLAADGATATGSSDGGAGCVSRPVEPTGDPTAMATFTKEIRPADWPEYVRIAVGLLPARTDYVVQSDYSWCDWPAARASNAYVVINLGHLREHGHITLDVYRHYDAAVVAATCADLGSLVNRDHPAGAPEWHLDFCDDATAAAPMVFGASLDYERVVGAVYPDGRAVVMDHLADRPHGWVLTAADMRPVVTSPALIGQLPAE